MFPGTPRSVPLFLYPHLNSTCAASASTLFCISVRMNHPNPHLSSNLPPCSQSFNSPPPALPARPPCSAALCALTNPILNRSLKRPMQCPCSFTLISPPLALPACRPCSAAQCAWRCSRQGRCTGRAGTAGAGRATACGTQFALAPAHTAWAWQGGSSKEKGWRTEGACVR